jgi:hypothetical protein
MSENNMDGMTPTSPQGLPTLAGTINGKTITDPNGEQW